MTSQWWQPHHTLDGSHPRREFRADRRSTHGEVGLAASAAGECGTCDPAARHRARRVRSRSDLHRSGSPDDRRRRAASAASGPPGRGRDHPAVSRRSPPRGPERLFHRTHPIAFYDLGSALFPLLPLLALLALVAAIATLVEGRMPSLSSPTISTGLAILAAVVVVVVVVAGGVAHIGLTNASAAPGDLSISATKDTTFSTGSLGSTQNVSIFVSNGDDTFHTFTIDGVVNQQLTPGSTHRVTFTLKPGQYRYYCTVPGHDATMHGILTVH